MPKELVIEANSVEQQYWKDLWNYRELFGMLAWRDIAIRYKQTAIGILWAVIRPVLTVFAFTFVFDKVAKLPSEGSAPYVIMVYSAMLPWQLFSTAVLSASDSLINNSNLVSKVYFPRLLVPASAVAVSVLDFVISFVILLLMMTIYRFMPSSHIFAVLPLTLLAGLLALGPGLWLCAVNVRYRDFRYALPFLTQFGLYVTPVGFSSSIVPEKWRALFECNPMVGVVDGFRWAIIGNIEFPLRSLTISTVVALFFIFIGAISFRKMEKNFVDVI